MDLLKVRVSDVLPMAFSLLVNDQQIRNARTFTVEMQKVRTAVKDCRCYSVILPSGALVGFFCIPIDTADKKASVYYIKESARSTAYMDAFWELISDTFYGEIHESISRFNTQNFDALLSRKIVILERTKYYGYNYNLNS